VVEKHPDRFVGFGSVPLQSVADSVAIAEEAKSMGLKGLEIGNAVGDKPLDDPSFEPFFEAAQRLDLLLFVHPLEGGLDRDDPLAPILGNVLQFTYRTTMMVERMIIKGMFERYPNLRLCLSHGGGLLPFNIWRLDHSYGLRAELKKSVPRKPSEYLKKIYFDQCGVSRDKNTVVYCRIGERSSHTWFVLTYLLGLNNVRNYDGSWTEWGNKVGAPIEKSA